MQKIKNYLLNIVVNDFAALVFLPNILRRKIYRIAGHKLNPTAKVFPLCFLGDNGKLVLGEKSFINYRCFLDLSDNIIIGDNCAIGFECKFITSFHAIGGHDRRAGEGLHAPIFIGDGCWIGANCTILPGVKIADGCIIGANSLVTKDTEPDSLYVGSSAKKIKAYNYEKAN